MYLTLWISFSRRALYTLTDEDVNLDEYELSIDTLIDFVQVCFH